MQRFGDKQRHFQRRVKWISLISQLPLLCAGIIICQYFDLRILPFFMCYLYFLFGFCFWHYSSIPEVKLNRKIIFFIVMPYLIWQLTSLIALVPILSIFCITSLIYLLSHHWLAHLPLILTFVTVISLLIACYGYFIRRCKAVIKYVPVKLNHSTHHFAGYKVAHLSDLHIGNMTTLAMLSKWIKQLNALKPDVVCITGDFITYGDLFIDELCNLMAQIEAPHGVLCCTGNHDYFANSIDKLIQALEKKGVIVLQNNVHRITYQNCAINFIGIEGVVDNFLLQSKLLDQALKELSPHQAHILLAHDPLVFPAAIKHKIFLTLSGHTHGGQIAHPYYYRKNLAAKRYCYNSGLYQHNENYLYVNNGLGTALFPFRFGTTPEIVIFNFHN